MKLVIKGAFDSTDDHPGVSFLCPEGQDPDEWAAANSRTKQADAEECDINVIVKRHGLVKIAADAAAVLQRYGDISDAPTYQEALNIVNAAETEFMALPSAIRGRFNNDPLELMKFVHSEDKNDLEESYKLGLRVRPEAKEMPRQGDAVKVEPVETQPAK